MSRQTISTSGKVFRVKFRNQVDALYLVPIGSTNSLSQEGAKLALCTGAVFSCVETPDLSAGALGSSGNV